MKRYRIFLGLVLLINVAAIIVYGYIYMFSSVPGSIMLVKGEAAEFDFNVPASGYVYSSDNEDEVKSVFDFSKPFSMVATADNDFSVEVKAFGIFKLKDVDVNVVDEQYAIPCGMPVGIYIETEGVMVVDTGKITDKNNEEFEPAINIVKPGDYIFAVDGVKVHNKAQLIKEVNKCEGKDVKLTIKRDSSTFDVKIKPVKSKNDDYKLGIWVRDDMQGIGTLTFITNDRFGALGHSVNDIDTGLLVDVSGGSLYKAKIINIVKGSQGKPGELSGVINYSDTNYIGDISGNSLYGVYGKIDNASNVEYIDEPMPIGFKQDVKEGKAYIRSAISGEFKDYEIEIVNVSYGKSDSGKSLEIKVVDKELINMTGGIVQGMSGTPIIQDGKFVGAVTHVFVNDPTKGYGVFAETMLEQK